MVDEVVTKPPARPAGPSAASRTLDDVSDAIEHNASVATELTRRALARGRISSGPQAFGTRAHSLFEGLNDRLNRALIAESSPFRVISEEFRDAAGATTTRRANGSIGADVQIKDTANTTLKVMDLKTHGGRQIPMSSTRQNQFKTRFGLPAEEIYRQR
jgi:hypothetical protein